MTDIIIGAVLAILTVAVWLRRLHWERQRDRARLRAQMAALRAMYDEVAGEVVDDDH